MLLFEKARQIGFSGIGVSQRGDHAKRFVHLDTKLRKALWSYWALDWANCFSQGGFIVSYSKLHQMWEVITEKDGIEVSYRWFKTKEKAEAFCMGRLYQTKIQQ